LDINITINIQDKIQDDDHKIHDPITKKEEDINLAVLINNDKTEILLLQHY